jgi:hypothetical protein
MKKYIFYYVIFLLFFSAGRSLMGQSIAPQLWNNIFVGWDANDRFTMINTASFNILLSEEFPWNEISLASTTGYRFHKNFRVLGTIYVSRVQQTLSLSNWELRPVIGFAINSNNQKRFVISNLSRLEFRYLIYSDNTNATTGRFRNLTILTVSLNKRTIVEDNSLNLFATAEFFYNFNEKAKERFVNQSKFKLGLAYRLSYKWRFNFGLMYQDSKEGIVLPVLLPTDLITNYIIEWSVGFFINRPDN